MVAAMSFKTEKRNVVLNLFFCGIVLGWAGRFLFATPAPSAIILFILVLSVFMLNISWLLFLLYYWPRVKSISAFKVKAAALCLFGTSMSLVGALSFVSGSASLREWASVAVFDFGAFTYYFAPIVLALLHRKGWVRFLITFVAFSCLSFVWFIPNPAFALGITTDDRMATIVVLGRNVYALHFALALASVYLAIAALCFLRSGHSIYFLGFSLVIILIAAFFYGKRQSIIEFVFLIFISLYAFGSWRFFLNRGVFRAALLVLSAFIVFVFNFQSELIFFWERLAARFIDTGEAGIGEFDRVIEARHVLENLSLGSLILYGNGFGSTDDNVISIRLHLGVGNLIMKGGGIFMFAIIVMIVYNLKSAFNFKAKSDRAFVVGLNIVLALSLSYSAVWSWFPTTALAGLAIFAPELIRLKYQLQQR